MTKNIAEIEKFNPPLEYEEIAITKKLFRIARESTESIHDLLYVKWCQMDMKNGAESHQKLSSIAKEVHRSFFLITESAKAYEALMEEEA